MAEAWGAAGRAAEPCGLGSCCSALSKAHMKLHFTDQLPPSALQCPVRERCSHRTHSICVVSPAEKTARARSAGNTVPQEFSGVKYRAIYKERSVMHREKGRRNWDGGIKGEFQMWSGLGGHNVQRRAWMGLVQERVTGTVEASMILCPVLGGGEEKGNCSCQWRVHKTSPAGWL